MDPKRQILEMLAEGKLQPDEATRLLAALKSDRSREPRHSGARLVVQVWQEDRVVFNMRIPLMLVKLGARLIPRNTVVETQLGSTNLDLQSIKWEEVLELAARGELGEVLTVDVDDAESGQLQIRVYCE